MALAQLTMTTNKKAIDFHKNDAEIVGLESDDEYIYADKIIKISVLDVGLMIGLIDGDQILLSCDQVEKIGVTEELPHFTSVTAMKDAIKTMLEL